MIKYVVPASQFMRNSNRLAEEMAVKDKNLPSNQNGLKMDEMAFRSDSAAGMSSMTMQGPSDSAAKPILNSSVSSRRSTGSSNPVSTPFQPIYQDMVGLILTSEPLGHAKADQEEQLPVHPFAIELSIPGTTSSTITTDDGGDDSTIAISAIDESAISNITCYHRERFPKSGCWTKLLVFQILGSI